MLLLLPNISDRNSILMQFVFNMVEYIRGYDVDGNEKLWIVTSGNVNSLALVDFNNDGKNEVIAII